MARRAELAKQLKDMDARLATSNDSLAGTRWAMIQSFEVLEKEIDNVDIPSGTEQAWMNENKDTYDLWMEPGLHRLRAELAINPDARTGWTFQRSPRPSSVTTTGATTKP